MRTFFNFGWAIGMRLNVGRDIDCLEDLDSVQGGAEREMPGTASLVAAFAAPALGAGYGGFFRMLPVPRWLGPATAASAVLATSAGVEMLIDKWDSAPDWVKAANANVFHPFNENVGRLASVFDVAPVLSRDVARDMGPGTGYSVDLELNVWPYSIASGVGYLATGSTLVGPAVVGAVAALDYAGNRSQMSIDRRDAAQFLDALGVNGSDYGTGAATAFGSFGQALATEFQSSRSDFRAGPTTPADQSAALVTFGQLYLAHERSDRDLGLPNSLALSSPTGWGPQDAVARETMLEYQNIALTPGGGDVGAVFFPNGQSITFDQGKGAATLDPEDFAIVPRENHSALSPDQLTTDPSANDLALTFDENNRSLDDQEGVSDGGASIDVGLQASAAMAPEASEASDPVV